MYADDGFNSVAAINPISNTISTTIAVGNQPLAIALNHAGTRAYVANHYDNTLSVIDTLSNSVIGTIPLPAGGQPAGRMAISPDDTRLYEASGPGPIWVIDLTGHTASISVTDSYGSDGVALSPDGSLGYTVDTFGGGSVGVIDTVTNSVTAQMRLFVKPASCPIQCR